ncbi:MAG: ABC transporter substrate-binding protein [Rhodobacterales bacterium]
MLNRLTITAALLAGFALPALVMPAMAEPDPKDWDSVLQEARGQTVFWNAWGGDPRTNDYIAWAAQQVQDQFGVTLEHVKLSDTATAVSTVISEKAAGQTDGGSIDLIWINGANFAAMKKNDLLFGPWSEDLPNWALVDPEENPALTADFTVPVDGLEAPWSMARVVFYYDSARVDAPPRTMLEFLDWTQANPGRFTYPQPPDFMGTTFLKQALLELVTRRDVLYAPVEDANYEAVTAPLWDYIAALTPDLWRQGQAYPQNGPAQRQMMADSEIDIAISFNPGEASAAIANFELPDTVRSMVLEGGTIGNASFLAIPFNANAKAGALVVANYLMSVEAQLHKQNPDVMGTPTVLSMGKLTPEDAARFAALDLGIATLSPADLGPALPEPHPSWMERIAADWETRFGVAQ